MQTLQTKTTILSHYQQGIKIQSIADSLNLPKSTVKGIIYQPQVQRRCKYEPVTMAELKAIREAFSSHPFEKTPTYKQVSAITGIRFTRLRAILQEYNKDGSLKRKVR